MGDMMTTTTTKPLIERLAALTDNQRSVLEALARKGHFPGGGWVWDNYSTTKRYLDALVKKGLAEVDLGDKPGTAWRTESWTPTDEVIAHFSAIARRQREAASESSRKRHEEDSRRRAEREAKQAATDQLVERHIVEWKVLAAAARAERGLT